MFKFTNSKGRRVWIKPSTVLLIWEETKGEFCIQCVGSVWTTDWPTIERLLDVLKTRNQTEDEADPDWWKHGRPNPLDRDDDE